MAVWTVTDSNNASLDGASLGEFINNGPNDPNPGQPDGTITTRLGATYQNLQKALQDVTSNSAAINWTIDTSSVVMADPTTGKLRLNNADPLLATSIAVSSENYNGKDVSGYVAEWANSTNPMKGYVLVASELDIFIYKIYSVTDNGTWLEIEVSYTAGSGTFTNGAFTYVSFNRSGDKGEGGVSVSDYPTYQDALDSGEKLVVFPQGVNHVVSSSLDVPPDVHVVIEAGATVTHDGVTQFTMFKAHSGTTFSGGGTIDLTNCGASDASQAILWRVTQEVSNTVWNDIGVFDIKVVGGPSDIFPISVIGDTTGSPSAYANGFTVKGCTFSGGAGGAVYVARGSQNVSFIDNTVKGINTGTVNGWFVVVGSSNADPSLYTDYDQDDEPCFNVSISSNILDLERTAGYGGSGIILHGVRGGQTSGNIINRARDTAIDILSSRNVVASQNAIDDCGVIGIGIRVFSEDVTVNDNNISNLTDTPVDYNAPVTLGASGKKCRRITVANNNIYNCGRHGIATRSAVGAEFDDIVISGNTIRDTQYRGMFLNYLFNSRVDGNVITRWDVANNASGRDGIRIDNSDNVGIENNQITFTTAGATEQVNGIYVNDGTYIHVNNSYKYAAGVSHSDKEALFVAGTSTVTGEGRTLAGNTENGLTVNSTFKFGDGPRLRWYNTTAGTINLDPSGSFPIGYVQEIYNIGASGAITFDSEDIAANIPVNATARFYYRGSAGWLEVT